MGGGLTMRRTTLWIAIALLAASTSSQAEGDSEPQAQTDSSDAQADGDAPSDVAGLPLSPSPDCIELKESNSGIPVPYQFLPPKFRYYMADYNANCLEEQFP